MTKARNIADLGSNDVIETTSTGVDVTGTVTADGLTVDGLTTATSNSAAPQFTFGSSHPSGIPLLALKGASSAQIRYLDETNAIQTRLDFADSGKLSIVDGSGNKRLVADSNGDVSFYEDTGTTAKFVWDSSAERLGIGTSSPSTNLHVYDATTNVVGTFESGDADVYITLADGSTTSDTAMRIGVTSNDMHFSTSATERMRIDSSGNVGIGTASPQDELHIEANYPQIRVASDLNIIGSNNLTATVDGYGTDGIAWRVGRAFGSGDFQIVNHRSTPVTFDIGGTERARLDSSGNLLVGQTSVANSVFKLSAANTNGLGAEIARLSLGKSGTGYSHIGYNCAPTSTVNVVNKYIADRSSWIHFDSGRIETYTHSGSTTGTTSGSAGPYLASNGTSWTSSSDAKYKENVESISYGIESIQNLNPVIYNRNDRDGLVEIGFIAQEVETIIPEIVSIKDNGEYGLQYERFVPVLTKALQEALAKIEQLEQRVDAMENK